MHFPSCTQHAPTSSNISPKLYATKNANASTFQVKSTFPIAPLVSVFTPPAVAVLRASSAALRRSTQPPVAAALPRSKWRSSPWRGDLVLLYQNSAVHKPYHQEKSGEVWKTPGKQDDSCVLFFQMLRILFNIGEG